VLEFLELGGDGTDTLFAAGAGERAAHRSPPVRQKMPVLKTLSPPSTVTARPPSSKIRQTRQNPPDFWDTACGKATQQRL